MVPYFKALDLQCPTCNACGWCMTNDFYPGTGRIRAKRTHAARIKLARIAEPLTFDRAPSDSNGNPRYVVHFLNLLTEEESDNRTLGVTNKYDIACKRANTIGGRRYNNKRYGGGIVFDSYSIDETAKHISRVTGRTFIAKQG